MRLRGGEKKKEKKKKKKRKNHVAFSALVLPLVGLMRFGKGATLTKKKKKKKKAAWCVSYLISFTATLGRRWLVKRTCISGTTSHHCHLLLLLLYYDYRLLFFLFIYSFLKSLSPSYQFSLLVASLHLPLPSL